MNKVNGLAERNLLVLYCALSLSVAAVAGAVADLNGTEESAWRCAFAAGALLAGGVAVGMVYAVVAESRRRWTWGMARTLGNSAMALSVAGLTVAAVGRRSESDTTAVVTSAVGSLSVLSYLSFLYVGVGIDNRVPGHPLVSLALRLGEGLVLALASLLTGCGRVLLAVLALFAIVFALLWRHLRRPLA
jgi:hypothetical protein